MGSKKSHKNASHQSAAARRTSRHKSSRGLIVGVFTAVAVTAVFALFSSSDSSQPSVAVTDRTRTAPVAPRQSVEAPRGPVTTLPSTDLPPLPIVQFAAPRPSEVIRSAYEFAAAHPEVLDYVPCFCGCENFGHRSNHDCFVDHRSADGKVTAWDAHGIG